MKRYSAVFHFVYLNSNYLNIFLILHGDSDFICNVAETFYIVYIVLMEHGIF